MPRLKSVILLSASDQSGETDEAAEALREVDQRLQRERETHEEQIAKLEQQRLVIKQRLAQRTEQK